MSYDEDIRVGGYGPGGCTCTITACQFCPIHGDAAHLSHAGHALKREREAKANRWQVWIQQQTRSACPECGAMVEGALSRTTHRDWHIRVEDSR